MAKPVVDGLEHEMKDKVRFTRVDIGSDDGGRLAQRYGITAVPAFLALDAQGRVVYRKLGGRPDADEVKKKLAR
jgi:thioredoxin-like negative regulator of GroEL